MIAKPAPQAKLDSFDKKILTTLAVDGRISWRTLADKIHLTLTPTLRRVRRLEAEGYINGYGAIIDESRILGNISLTIFVSLEGDQADAFDAFETAIGDISQVVFCGRYQPSHDYIVNVYAKSIEEAHVVLRRLSDLDGVATIETSAVLRIARHMKPLNSWPRKASA